MLHTNLHLCFSSAASSVNVASHRGHLRSVSEDVVVPDSAVEASSSSLSPELGPLELLELVGVSDWSRSDTGGSHSCLAPERRRLARVTTVGGSSFIWSACSWAISSSGVSVAFRRVDRRDSRADRVDGEARLGDAGSGPSCSSISAAKRS